MSASKNEIERERREAKVLWTIQVRARIDARIVCREIRNRFGSELLSLRETFFSAGFAYQEDARTWIIIPPCDIIRVTAILQNKFDDRDY